MEEDCCPQPHLLAHLHQEEPASRSSKQAAPALSLRGAPASRWGKTGKTNHSLALSPQGLNVKFRLNKLFSERLTFPLMEIIDAIRKDKAWGHISPSGTIPLFHTQPRVPHTTSLLLACSPVHVKERCSPRVATHCTTAVSGPVK